MASRRQNNSYSRFVMGSRIDLLLNWWTLFLFLKETIGARLSVRLKKDGTRIPPRIEGQRPKAS